MSTVVTSVVRTVLPTGWGAILGALVAVLGLPASTTDLRTIATTALTVGSGWAVYAAARWLETRTWCPPALTRLLLGSVRQPLYPPVDVLLPTLAASTATPASGLPPAPTPSSTQIVPPPLTDPSTPASPASTTPSAQ